MNIVALNGSPRRKGNTTLLIEELLRGASESGAKIEEIYADQLQLKFCNGCLKCNLLKRCAMKGDDWEILSSKILRADVLIFASPIYFHHLLHHLKKVLDRFRSFLHVRITEHGLQHSPWHEWKKQFVLLLCLGSSAAIGAQPTIDLFKYITSILSPDNNLKVVVGTRLAVTNQVKMTVDELFNLYPKLGLPPHLAEEDYHHNQMLLKKCYNLCKELV